MSQYALLTLDLHDADSTKRKKFDQAMTDQDWKKFRVTTAWTATFQDGAASSVVSTTKQEVESAAKAAGISKWDAVVLVSDDPPTVF